MSMIDKTQARLAAEYRVTTRTIARWKAKGAPLQDADAMQRWLAEHQREKVGMTSSSEMSPQCHVAESRFSARSVSGLIEQLEAHIDLCRKELDTARAAQANARTISVMSKTYTDAIARLQQILVERDAMQAASEESFTMPVITATVADWLQRLQFLLISALTDRVAFELSTRGVASVGVVNAAIKTAIRGSIEPVISELYSEMHENLSGASQAFSLDDRKKLSHQITQICKGQSL